MTPKHELLFLNRPNLGPQMVGGTGITYFTDPGEVFKDTQANKEQWLCVNSLPEHRYTANFSSNICECKW